MNKEQQFVDLIKEGKVSDAMALIKEALTELSGEVVVDKKFEIAEKYGMKKKEISEESDDDKDDDDPSDEDDEKESDDEDDDKDE